MWNSSAVSGNDTVHNGTGSVSTQNGGNATSRTPDKTLSPVRQLSPVKADDSKMAANVSSIAEENLAVTSWKERVADDRKSVADEKKTVAEVDANLPKSNDAIPATGIVHGELDFLKPETVLLAGKIRKNKGK